MGEAGAEGPGPSIALSIGPSQDDRDDVGHDQVCFLKDEQSRAEIDGLSILGSRPWLGSIGGAERRVRYHGSGELVD